MTPLHQPLPVNGYVLAGGRSSRMGTDKALLPLAGRPLVEHAVTKLRRLCQQVAILSDNERLAAFAPLVKDVHPDCGPMSGIEAALSHARHDWSLILPVDVPFPPTAFLLHWMKMTLGWADRYRTRISLFVVDGVPQPALLMIHRDLGPYLARSLAEGRYKLFPELKAAAAEIAHRLDRSCLEERDAQGNPHRVEVLMQFAWSRDATFEAAPGGPPGHDWEVCTAAQRASGHLYFVNLNTPADFAEAGQQAGLLDT